MATTTPATATETKQEFMTVREASTLVGMSPSSVRRVIYPILEKDTHPDRSLISPTVSEAKKLRIAGHNFAWKISKELLMRQMQSEKRTNATREKNDRKSSGDASIIDILQRELEIKNKQIEQQNDVIRGLSERVREGNILMASLQKHLALPAGNKANDDTLMTVTNEAVEQKTPKKAVQKKSFFGSLFGK
ncbi:MAG: hypothetical protein ABL890_01410 [Candidatus Peribacteraceae bacterium]